MGAREKLNKLHLSGDVVLAAVAGIIAGSWVVFVVALVMLVGLDVHTGQIRPAKKRKHVPDDVERRTERRRA